jgi:hypothetical protein
MITVGVAMRFSVKIIACVALVAVIVTAALVTLAFFPPPESSVSHMFDVDLVYAYVGKINITEHSHFGMNVHSANLYPVFIVINYTYRGMPGNEPYDAKFEGYLVKLVSDTGVSASYTAYEGLELSQSSSVMPAMPNADTVSLRANMTVQRVLHKRKQQPWLMEQWSAEHDYSNPAESGLVDCERWVRLDCSQS